MAQSKLVHFNKGLIDMGHDDRSRDRETEQVVVDEDGRGALLVSADDPGDTEIIVKADADLGEGVEEISDIIKLSVIGATAKNLGLSASAPELKPVPEQ